MENAIERNGEAVAGEGNREGTFRGDDDGAGAEDRQVVRAVDGECRERGLHAGLLGEHQIVRPIAGGRLLEHRVGGDVRDDQGAGGGTVHADRDGGGGGVVQLIAVVDGGDGASTADHRRGRYHDGRGGSGAIGGQIGGADDGVHHVLRQKGDGAGGRRAGRSRGAAAAHGGGEAHGVVQPRIGWIGGDGGGAGGARIPLGDQVVGVDGTEAGGPIVSRTGAVTDEALHAVRSAEGAAYGVIPGGDVVKNIVGGLGQAVERRVDVAQPRFRQDGFGSEAVSYTHLRAHETRHDLVCRL